MADIDGWGLVQHLRFLGTPIMLRAATEIERLDQAVMERDGIILKLRTELATEIETQHDDVNHA